MPKKEGLEQLLVEELQDLFDAEKQLVRALPKMAKSVSDEELAEALRQHLEVTKQQVQRLEEVFESMDMPAKSKPCKAMKGLVEEGQEMIEEHDEPLLDSAIIGAGRRIEHYEMAGYEIARSLAQQLGMREAAQKLEETLREEMQADKQLAQLSKRIMKEAQAGGMEAEGEEMEESGSRSRGKSAKSASSRSSGSRSSAKSSGSKNGGRSSSNGGSSSRGRSGSSSASSSRAGSRTLTDHEEIRQWAEDRGATPSCVRGTGGKEDVGMIRLDFPGYSGEDSLQEIDWDEWFEKFDENGLALLVQEKTTKGQKSNFNKLVRRAG